MKICKFCPLPLKETALFILFNFPASMYRYHFIGSFIQNHVFYDVEFYQL